MTPAEKLRLVRMYGTLTNVDGKWVFKADPQKKCEIREMTHESRWALIELVYDNLRGIRIW
jgi:hypothetical protein